MGRSYPSPFLTESYFTAGVSAGSLSCSKPLQSRQIEQLLQRNEELRRVWPRTGTTPANRGPRTRRSEAGATITPPAQREKPSGQKGHPGATRELIDQPDQTVVLPLTGPAGGCRLAPIKQVAKIFKDQWQGILNAAGWHTHHRLRRGRQGQGPRLYGTIKHLSTIA
jgi:hypothetical protein